MRAGAFNDLPKTWLSQVTLLLGLSAGVSIAFFFVRGRKWPAIFLSVQAVLFVFVNYPQGEDISLCILFVGILSIELVVFLGFSFWITMLIELVFIVMTWVHPVSAWGLLVHAYSLMDMGILFLLALAFCLVGLTTRGSVTDSQRQKSEISSLSRSVGTLLTANQEFQNYAVQIGEKSTIEERKRLSREVHDVVGYTLINLKMMLESASDLACGQSPALPKLLAEAKEEVQNGLQETRKALRSFRDIQEEPLKGLANLLKLVNSFSHATGIEVVLNSGNIPWSFDETLDAAIYRLVQEAMTNAFRHGHATRIQINFWLALGRLLIAIDDNGVGAGTINPGIGLTGMRERVEPYGGQVSVSQSGLGFSLKVEIPYRSDDIQ